MNGFRISLFTLLIGSAICPAPSACSAEVDRQRSIAILRDDLPGVDHAVVDALVARLRKDDFVVTELTAAQVCDKNALTAEKFFLYIVPNCRTYPALGLKTLTEFARNNGHLLFLGGPFLDDPVWQRQGKWLNRQAVTAARRDAKPEYFPLGKEIRGTQGWIRTCNDPNSRGNWKAVSEGPDGTTCFKFWTRNLTGWDGYITSNSSRLFGKGHNLFTFMARSGPETRQIAVEIQEQDGSRWIATVDVTTKWQRVTISPDEFHYWPDSPTRKRRGKPGDRLRPEFARRVGFQLANSHTQAVGPGEHVFWIAGIGTCRNPVADMAMASPGTDNSLETLFPRYKVYRLHGSFTLKPSVHWEPRPGILALPATDLVCAIPRTMGRGFKRDQKWRFIPLLDAIDADGRYRGSPGWMLLNRAGPFAGSIFACLGWNVPTASSPTMVPLAGEIAQRLRRGVFLVEAGSEHFSYWPRERVRVGATAVNLGGEQESASLHVVIRDQHGEIRLDRTAAVDWATAKLAHWSEAIELRDARPGLFEVSTELLMDGCVIDRIRHEFAVLDTRRPAEDEFITVRRNNFYLKGNKWFPLGVNFWPLYVSGMNFEDFWAGWIQRPYYEPELIEQDLVRMKSLGINMVSIQSNAPKFYRNLLDFTRRCKKHDIHVNLFCGLASPLAFRERELRQFVETARLADNTTIMAYDTIWEPGNYVYRKDWRARWDKDWRAWITEQYGSIAAAEREWRYQCPRDDKGRALAPPDKQFKEDGDWRALMAAYRRFMDDHASRMWNRAHRKLREIDPNHLVSFRQGNTLPHDFTFTATPKHVDFMCPEGYAIPASDDGYDAAGFITKFIHFTTRGKPIVWSEFGQSVWDGRTMSALPDRIRAAADYHELFYRMVLETGANGTAPWWWPGGYRVGERSDYGVVNPDGTNRPAAQLMATYGPELKKDREWPVPTTWLEINTDDHAGGYWHICFNAGRDAYRKAVEEKGHLGVRTAGTGTTSADTPLTAVGNRPCTGKNPPKHLNAEFNWLQIRDATGRWVEARDGATIAVDGRSAVKARVSVGNTQEATWIAPGNDDITRGDVVLTTTDASTIRGKWPLPSATPYLADADFGEIILAKRVTQPSRVELRMAAEGRTEFGEKRTFTLIPSDKRGQDSF